MRMVKNMQKEGQKKVPLAAIEITSVLAVMLLLLWVKVTSSMLRQSTWMYTWKNYTGLATEAQLTAKLQQPHDPVAC